MFEALKAFAEKELTALKAEATSVEARIEAAFTMGAVHHALDAIKAEVSTLEEKLVAAFHLGKTSAAPVAAVVVPEVTLVVAPVVEAAPVVAQPAPAA